MPDGKSVVSYGLDGVVRHWDLRAKQPIYQFARGEGGYVRACALLSDGRVLAVRSEAQKLLLFELPAGKLIRRLQGPPGDYYKVALAPGGRYLAVLSIDRRQPDVRLSALVTVWDVESGEELGILRDVDIDPTGHVTVTITPTYSGCPAMDVIRADVTKAVQAAGYPDVSVRTVLTPAWTTDAITEAGREKLRAAGIAPPGPAVRLTLTIRCPRCGSPDTEELSHFGATACKALWRCRACAEPFEHVKAL